MGHAEKRMLQPFGNSEENGSPAPPPVRSPTMTTLGKWRMYFTNSLAAENTERFTITTTGLCQRMPLAGLSVCFSKLEKSSWPFPVLWRI